MTTQLTDLDEVVNNTLFDFNLWNNLMFEKNKR